MPKTLSSGVVVGALLLSLTPAGAGAATKLEAPVKMLTKPHHRIAVLEAVDKTDGGRVAFVTRETFHGEAEEKVTLRMGEEVYGDVEAGETYVVAFSNVRRNFRFRELHEVDPEGFRVLNLLGGGPALFEDTAGVRLLFANRDTEKPPAPKALLAAAVATLSSDDPRTRAFAALELRHRPEWLALMSSADARAVRATIADTGVAPEVRHYLLETARELPAGLTGSWLVKEGRSILRSVDPQLDLTSSFPLLAINAIGVVEEGGGKADGAVVSPFLGSNNPGVVKAALKALDRLDPALARQRAGKVLERGGLHAESRRVLGEYLEPAQR